MGSRLDDKPVGKSIDKIKIKSAVQMTFDRQKDGQGLGEIDRSGRVERDGEGTMTARLTNSSVKSGIPGTMKRACSHGSWIMEWEER